MCGIAGYLHSYSSNAIKNRDHATLVTMTKTLHHRGPDGNGVWQDELCGFAHTRLAIRDLSEHGAQPMSDIRNTLHIVYNGEIYNIDSLRSDLLSRGSVFRGTSDTEVLLEAYKYYGASVVDHLNGMFAFAIWDSTRQEMFLARDRAGQKPLFYGWSGDSFIFASEIKAILDWPDFDKTVNLEAIHHYLALQYVPSPLSAFSNIRKMPPGHRMVLKPGKRPQPERYWSIPETQIQTSYAERLETTLNLLKDAVNRRMVADTPIGAFLSGGIDSSAVVALMKTNPDQPIKTFSLGFDEKEFDESKFAQDVAARCGSEHYETRLRSNEVADLIPKITQQYDEPFADVSALPTFCISQLAKQHVSVVLSGDGGDELFLGYERYARAHSQKWIDNVPNSVKSIAGAFASGPNAMDNFRPLRVARRVARRMSTSGPYRYEADIVSFPYLEKIKGYANVMQPFLSSPTMNRFESYFSEGRSQLAGAALADFHTYLPDNLMTKVDIASMAHGLETRSPFLDHRLIEWASRLSDKDKYYDGETKALLKSTMRNHLPVDILNRKKMGFGVPLEHWLRGPLRELTYDILKSKSFKDQGYFKPGYVEKILDEHMTEKKLHHPRIWTLIMLAQWHQTLQI